MSLSTEKKYLFFILSKKDFSRNDLFNRLRKRDKISLSEIESLLNEFEENNWISDKRFAINFLASQLSKSIGKKRIINTAIHCKKLPIDLIERIIENENIDWFMLCKTCLNKKYKDASLLMSDSKLKKRAFDYLVYNGFSFDEINSVLKR